MNTATPVQQIAGVGPIFQKKLKKLGIKTVGDLIYHFPHRYEDFSNVIPIAKIKAGEKCSIQGKVLKIQNSRTWKKRMSLTEAIVEDQSGAVKVVWFNQPYLANVLKEGELIMLSGKGSWRKDGFSLNNPAYEKINTCATLGVAQIIPVYPETDGLSSRWLRHILKPIIAALKDGLTDPLPAELGEKNELMPFKEAIWQIHFPESLEKAKKARERFAFQNAFFIQLWVMRERMKLAGERAAAIPLNLEFIQRLVGSLPFKLTDSQRKSAWQILKDIEKPSPMNRLLEGDVGSGKTVVAALAILNTVKAGYQAAFMAPTEILAKQHFKTIWELLNNFKMDVGLLTGKTDKFYSRKLKNQDIEISRKKLLDKAQNGEINLIIGTHALIQDKVKFGKLGLVILDEQHRFGVEQRAKLCQPNYNYTGDTRVNSHGCHPCNFPDIGSRVIRVIPHLLSMTATPIPRTLALTVYGDLDLSLIDELPQGRKKVITKVVSQKQRNLTYDFIKKEVGKGRQAFVICPRIEARLQQSSWAEVKAVKEEYEKLNKEVFPNLRVAMLHGKMTGQEKEKAMRDFKNKRTDILVSTSVVEVGVDVPNATVMMIEGAERFGLAQLHQFRGRVGRAQHQSYCFLFTSPSASDNSSRLKALVSSENGFDLAEKDLEIRGPGDFLGRRQWGSPDLAMEALKNIHLVEETRQAAKEILANDPSLKKYPLLKEKLDDLEGKMHWE